MSSSTLLAELNRIDKDIAVQEKKKAGYVNYYTRERMNPGDIPPIGILLCADKDDAVVRYTLPEDNQQIFAAKYMPYLPSKEELKRELNIDDFEKK